MAANGKPSSPKKFITVLSMDGGGVRGIIPAMVLQALEKEIQNLENNKNARIADYFDLIAGTSAGGISASILTATEENGRPKYSTDDLVDFHMNRWGDIFPQVSDKNLKELLWVNHLVGPMNQNASFCKVMEEVLGDAKLSKTATHVVIPSFNIKNMQPHIFSSFEAKRNKKLDTPLKHVTLATSSAPLYFPPYFFENFDADEGSSTEYDMVDGYVVADNPTWIAVTEALKEYTEEHGKSTGTICKLLILSLGTGSAKFESKYDAKSTSTWGTMQWMYCMQNRCRPFTEVFQAAATNLVDIQLSCFLAAVGCTENYLRIQKTDLDPELVPVDNSDKQNMIKLHRVAESVVKENQAALKEFAKKLVAEKHAGGKSA